MSSQKNGNTSQELFARESSGFVREINWVTAMFISMSFIAFYALPVAFFGGFWLQPNGLPIVAATLSWIVMLPHGYLWTKITQSYPRTGADYVFTSRVLKPAIGTAVGLTFAITQMIMNAATTYFGVEQLQISFNALGIMHGGIYASIASALDSPGVILGVGAIVFAFVVLLSTIAMKHINKIFGAVTVIALLSFVVTAVILGLANTGSMGSIISTYGFSIAKINSAAAAATPLFTDVGLATIGLMVITSTYLPFINGATSIAGEIRGGSKSFSRGIILALIIVGVLTTIFIGATVSGLTSKFFIGAGQMGGSYAALTNPVFDAILLSNNIGMQIFLAISTFFWYVAVLFGISLFVSRYLMAVAFDRVLPSPVAYVSQKFHTPVVAQLISLGVTLAGLTIITLTSLSGAFWFATDTANLMAILLGFIIVALAVITASAKKAGSLKGNRWILIGAAIFDVAILGTYCAYMLLYSPIYLGVQVSVVSIGLLTSPFIAGIAIYYGMRYYRRRHEGLDLDNTFKEIPPE